MRLIYEILVMPHKAFEKIKEKPRLGLGLAVVLILEIAAISVERLLNIPRYHEFVGRYPGMTPSQLILTWVLIRLPVAILFGGLLKFVFITFQGIVVHLFTRIAGGQARFKKAFGIAIWSRMPVIAGAWIKSIVVVLFAWSSSFQIGLETLGGEQSGLHHVFELFPLWSLILIAEGMVRVLGCKRLRSYLVAFGLWVVWILIYLAGWKLFI